MAFFTASTRLRCRLGIAQPIWRSMRAPASFGEIIIYLLYFFMWQQGNKKLVVGCLKVIVGQNLKIRKR